MRNQINLIHFFMLIVLFFISPWSYAAEKYAALVIKASGKVSAVNAQQEVRPLSRRSPLYLGDKIVTGDNGQIQIRFTDGTLLSAQHHSSFIINHYQYKEGNKPNNFSLTLIKGGFRNVTGAIGKENPQQVAYKTGIATIGIRGTDTEEFITEKQEFIKVRKGRILFSLDSGTCSQDLEENEAVVLNKDTLQFIEMDKNDPIFTSLQVPLPESQEIEKVIQQKVE